MSIVLTPAKAAILLGTSDRTVRSMIQRRILPAMAVGRRMDGRQGPVRYEITLEDLYASGRPIDLARLPLLAAMSQEATPPEREPAAQQGETTLLQTLQDEYARLRTLREVLEQTLTECSERCARLDAWEARLSLSTARTFRGRLAHLEALSSVPHPAPALVEGSSFGLTPLWIEGFGSRIRFNGRRHLLVIDNSIVALSPTEYRLVIEILTRYAQWQTTRWAGCFVVDQAALQQFAGRTSPRLVARHLTNANAKLAPFGVRIQAVVGSGYTVLLENIARPKRATLPAARVDTPTPALNRRMEMHDPMSEALRYQTILTWSEPEQLWVAEVPDVPECQATGQNAETALRASQESLQLWLQTARDAGRPVPPPQKRPLGIEQDRVIQAARAAGRGEAEQGISGFRHDVYSLAGRAYEQAATMLWDEPIATDNTQVLVERLAQAYQEGYREVAQEQGWTLEE